MTGLPIRELVPLAPLTTLELGGDARFFLKARSESEIIEAYRWAAERELDVVLLGGGSNIVVSDAGFPGLVVQLATRGREVDLQPRQAIVHAAAGENWDELVAYSVDRGWAGIECLSGIPGRVGATPIQNVSAYGQEISDTLQSVRLLDRQALAEGSDAIVELAASELEFAYRTSRLKREAERFVVLAASFALRRDGGVRSHYPEVAAKLGEDGTPERARELVLQLRRSRSMLLDPSDPNRRSVGSFFINVIVPEERANEIVELSLRRGLVSSAEEVPRHPAGAGHQKLPAAWLIEKSGIERGMRDGPVGVSSHHTLCLVHHGGGTTADLLRLAREIRRRVEDSFGLCLEPEPRMVGFDQPPL